MKLPKDSPLAQIEGLVVEDFPGAKLDDKTGIWSLPPDCRPRADLAEIVAAELGMLHEIPDPPTLGDWISGPE